MQHASYRADTMVGYIRVSTDLQARQGAGLAAQKAAIKVAAQSRGWTIRAVYKDEGHSGQNLDRPGLRQALEVIAAGGASGLVVAKLDRLSRSVLDYAKLLKWFDEAGATLIALDLGIDTSGPIGRMVSSVVVSMAEWERQAIAMRTREALAMRRAQGRSTGRPSVSDRPDVAERIRALRADGETLRSICEYLNTEGVPTSRGAQRWRPSSVQAVLGYKRNAPHRSSALPLLAAAK